MSLVTLADYKSALKITSETEDAKITQYALEIEQRVKSYLGFDIEEAEYTYKYDGEGLNRLFPKHIPVTAITKLEVYEGLDVNNVEEWEEWTLGDEYERLLIEDNGYVIYMDGSVFPEGNNNIRLTYTAGYTGLTLPQDILSACKKLMKLFYLEIDKGMLAITSTSISAGASSSDTLDSDAANKILKEIQHYRLARI